ncbi:MAG: hypothetical protein WC212_02045 [Candidatus Delongbacteria bacterium]
MKSTSKILPAPKANRVIEIYSKFDLEQLPKLIGYKGCEDGKMELEFEWIEGSVISAERMSEAFFELGRFHSLNKIADREVGFTTVCHGDFHRNNIILSASSIKFVDVTYIHEGWNYSDLDYVDFLNVYDKEKYPWMIRAGNCLEAYHEGAGIKSEKEMNEKLKLMIAKFSLERNVVNGKKNKLDTSFEEKILVDLSKKMK